MKKSLLGFITLIFLAGLVTSCDKEDEVKSSVKEITSFTLEGKTGSIDKVTRTITFKEFSFDKYEALKKAVPTVEYTPGAILYPSVNTVNDFTVPQKYWVSAKDETAVEYKIVVTIEISDEALIKGYKVLDPDNDTIYTGVVDSKEKTVKIEIPYAKNNAKLRTVVDISYQATIPPSFDYVTYIGGESFNLKVTAEDGETQNTYTVLVNLSKNTEAKINNLAFIINGKTYTSSIDHEEKTIIVSLPTNTEMAEIEFKVEKSYGASFVSPEGLNAGSGKINLSNVADIRILSEDGKLTEKYTFTPKFNK